MGPKVIRIEIKVTRTMATILAGLLVALALLIVPLAGAHPPLEGPGGQGGVTVASSVPTMISYQGQLLDSGSDPVLDGTYSMTFRLYNVPSGGTAFWEETHPSVEITDGLFNVLLGEYVSLDPDDDPYPIPIYLGVTVGSDPEMTPRQQMVSVPYAFRAEIADQCVTDNDWDGAGTGKMYTHYLTDNVGIGTTAPGEKLDVEGHVRFYDATNPGKYTLFENNAMTMYEHNNRNKLWISAYDQAYGNLIYTEDPQEGSGQGFGIAGGSWMAPFDRFVVNTDEMFLGYSILPGDGGPSLGGDGTGNLYAHGSVGIGTTSPEDYKLRVNQDFISIDRGILLETSAGSEDLSIWVAGDAGIYTKSNKNLHFGTNNDYARNMTLSTDGNVGIGTTSPQSTLQVEGDPGYLQIDSYNGVPPASDCDSADERGRMILDFANNRLYVCTGSGGWKYAELQ